MTSQSQMQNVAIVGRPNVGKSALFNRLAGRKIAIVHDQPGITRDRISAPCTRGKRPFLLWDTGGIIGAGESELIADVRRGVEQVVRESNLLVLVVDAQSGLSPMDEEFARLVRKSAKPIVLAINKIDNEKREQNAADFDSLGFEETISISAEHNRGISDLLEAIENRLPTQEIESAPTSIEKRLALAIIGRPNVGKSSLLNAIMKNERAIVSELPGTTRDAVDVFYDRNGDHFVLIDTAGIRRRGKHSTSVEVFSVMRAERTIRRADVCLLVVDVTSGVTAQDKKIAGLVQNARKAAVVVVNKFDLVSASRSRKKPIDEVVAATREQLFFLGHAPVLVVSARTGEHVDRIFRLIKKIRCAAEVRIGTGVLNRLLRSAFAANPPPMVKGQRLKLFYAAQPRGKEDRQLSPPEFVLFVNNPRLLNETYGRYLEARIREVEPYTGLPIIMTLRPRSES